MRRKAECLVQLLGNAETGDWLFEGVGVHLWLDSEIGAPSSVIFLDAFSLFDPLSVFMKQRGSWYAAIGPFQASSDSSFPVEGETYVLGVDGVRVGAIEVLETARLDEGRAVFLPLRSEGGDPLWPDDEGDDSPSNDESASVPSESSRTVARTSSVAIRQQALTVLVRLAEQMLDAPRDASERSIAQTFLGVAGLLRERLDYVDPDHRSRAALRLLEVVGTEVAEAHGMGRLARIGKAAARLARDW